VEGPISRTYDLCVLKWWLGRGYVGHMIDRAMDSVVVVVVGLIVVVVAWGRGKMRRVERRSWVGCS